MNKEYHLQFFGPLKNEFVDWPEGSVSVYQITGERIAEATIWERNAEGKLEISERWPWPGGFLGCFRSLEEATAAIAADRLENAA